MKGYRTIVFNVIAFVGMTVTLLTGTSVEGDVIVLQEQTAYIIEAITAVWVIGAIWLRHVTDSPIFKSRPNDSSFRRKH